MNFKRQFQWLTVIGFTSILGCEGGATEDAQVPSGDREEIQSMHDSRTLHYNNRNLDALMATYSVEAVVLTGTLQVASGANAIRELIGDEMAQSTSLRNDLKEVLLFDDRAVLWGEYTWSGTSPENSLELNTSGPYMLELSEEDGVWKVSREMWTQIEELGEGTAWGIIPQDFEESSEWGDEIDLLANLYNRGNPAALAEFFFRGRSGRPAKCSGASR
ncbi:MAG: hypothetical protein CME30_04030 [Gemmatimonadetes bacterium]|nr:hypothetical protein [Gemmatimonadota bacterium]